MAPMITPGMTFDDAAQTVLAYLREHIPMGFWSITRMENGRQSYLYLQDNAYGLPQGGSHPWEDSYCIRMAAGEAPRVAPDAQAVPAYREAQVNAIATIGAYAGAPIHESDGTLFGAICGLDAEKQPSELANIEPILDLLGSLLNMVLAAERAQAQAALLVGHAVTDAETDALTGLFNRRGWDQAVVTETARFDRLGDPTLMVLLDLDGLKDINDQQGHAAGDQHLLAASKALRAGTRPTDIVARLGGDEFGIILCGCSEAAGPPKIASLSADLERAGVAASIGWSPVTIAESFASALAAADTAMYAVKSERKARRSHV